MIVRLVQFGKLDQSAGCHMKPKYDLDSADFGLKAIETYAQMRAQDPIFEYARLPQPDPLLRWLNVDGPSVWYIASFKEVEQVIKDDKTFVCDNSLVSADFAANNIYADPIFNRLTHNHLLSLDGADHLRLRTLVNKAFSPGAVSALQPKVQRLANHFLDQAAAKGAMELISDYAFPLSINVICELLGVPTERVTDFRRWADAVFLMDPFMPASREQLVGEFDHYVRQLIAEHAENPADDLLSRLILAENEGEKLDENELHAMVFVLVIGGHQTTMSAIGNGALVLLQHPTAWKALQDEPAMMPKAVEELLRFESPLARTVVPRWVTRDVDLDGHLLRQGDLVVPIISSANRDQAMFPSADSLNMERQPNRHLAFGIGIHYCLGAPLARMEVQIALNTLIQRFPDLQLDIAENDIAWRPTPALRCLECLPVRWGER